MSMQNITNGATEKMVRHLQSTAVPASLSRKLAESVSLHLDGYSLNQSAIMAAREYICSPEGGEVLQRLHFSLARADLGEGWAVVSQDEDLSDDELVRAATGILCAVGTPFRVIDAAPGIWNDLGVDTQRDPGVFGGTGLNALHVDVPNVDRIPDYSVLLCLRPDPAGGGVSLIADLRAAAADLSETDRSLLSEEVFYEGKVFGLSGVGSARLPFSVIDITADDSWIRYSGRMIGDSRNMKWTDLLIRYDAALWKRRTELPLRRGDMLILDQRRIAHGRLALGDQTGISLSDRRRLGQAKVKADHTAPAWVGKER